MFLAQFVPGVLTRICSSPKFVIVRASPLGPVPKSTRRPYSGKFIRRRRSWKRLFRWVLLSLLGADGLGAGFEFFRLGFAVCFP